MVIDIKTKEEKKEVTVCIKCSHFHNKEPNSPRKDVWYNHLCKAVPLPKAIDPYDGEEKSFGFNDSGCKYYVDSVFGYANCRDINDGKCKHFNKS